MLSVVAPFYNHLIKLNVSHLHDFTMIQVRFCSY